MSKIGNYVVGLEELTGAVMALDPFGDMLSIDDICGCNYCVSEVIFNGGDYINTHKSDCRVIKLREVLTKQEQSK